MGDIFIVIVLIIDIFVYAFLHYYFMSHIRRSVYRKKWCYPAAFTVFAAISFSIMYFKNDVVSILVLSLCVGLMEYFLFHPKGASVFYCVIFTTGICACQIFVWAAVPAMVQFISITSMDIYEYQVAVILIKLVVEVCYMFLFLRLFQEGNGGETSKWQYIGFLLIPILSIVYLVSLIVMGEVFVYRYGVGLLILNIGLIMGMDIFVIYLFHSMEKNYGLKQEVSLYRQKEELQFHYYECVERQYQDSRKVIHDMSNHIAALKELYKSGDTLAAENYTADLEEMLQSFERVRYTGHHMLNLILNDKLNREDMKQAEIKVLITDSDLSEIRDIDITTIFSNLLDNAREELLAQKGKGYLTLKIDQVHEFIVICMENSMDSSRAGKETKEDVSGNKIVKKKGHLGLGLKNVRTALEKYDGSMELTKSADVFRVSITIPAGK